MSLTTVALIITIFACVFQTTTQESPLPVLTCVASSAETGYLHRICSHGEWPADAGTLSLPADTRYITFLYVTFQLDDAGTVAAIPGGLSNLTTLNFINTTTVTATGESTIIPFQQLVRQVDRAKITVLNFEFASFGQVDKHLLAGFTGLESLSVSQSSVLSIHPEAFEPLRFERTIVEEGVDVTETTTKLRGFWFDFNSGLSSLPWDILFTVSKSLETFSVISNPDLSQLTILQNVTNAPVMRVHKTLIIFANKGLTTLPASVLDKIPGLAAPATAADRTEIHFTGNGNQCDGCGLSPLVNWAKSRPETSMVALRLTCQSNCADNITGVEQSVGHAYATLTSDFWRTYVEPACNADLTPVACRSVSGPVSASTPSSVSGGPIAASTPSPVSGGPVAASTPSSASDRSAFIDQTAFWLAITAGFLFFL